MSINKFLMMAFLGGRLKETKSGKAHRNKKKNNYDNDFKHEGSGVKTI